MKKIKPIYIAIIGILAALAFVLSLVTISLGNLRISFASLPVSLSAYTFGPVVGFIVGTLSSFLDQLLKYGFTATTILWILPSGIRGLVNGYSWRLLKGGNGKSLLLKFQISGIIGTIITTFANTFVMYVDSKMYGYYSPVYIWGDFIARLTLGIITAIIVHFIIYFAWRPIQEAIKNHRIMLRNQERA